MTFHSNVGGYIQEGQRSTSLGLSCQHHNNVILKERGYIVNSLYNILNWAFYYHFTITNLFSRPHTVVIIIILKTEVWGWTRWCHNIIFRLSLCESGLSGDNLSFPGSVSPLIIAKLLQRLQMAQLNVLFILFARIDFRAECRNLNLLQVWRVTPTSCFHLCLPWVQGRHHGLLLFWKLGSNSLFPQEACFHHSSRCKRHLDLDTWWQPNVVLVASCENIFRLDNWNWEKTNVKIN